MQNKHYFIAVKLDEQCKNWLMDIQSYFKTLNLPFKSWVHRDDFHITLQFLGALEQEKLLSLSDELEKINKIPKFDLEIGNVGTFGKSIQPRVLWVDVVKNNDLNHLHQKIKEILIQMTLRVEKRPYRPHITLAKKWRGEETIHLSKSHTTTEMKKFQVDQIALYEIYPNEEVKYKPIKVISLK
ncbi:RNA 2',3'-cyclic phosphodiesterase [Gracilibacillus sp. YIM 98692]|uniref:RNA 2',3'-cyclic phosphodiesterase n=1 Tax=Gracilibacillus sp. YIM 98692 TaxID=2663532 RepID=UPI0013D2A78D|nr:RNA 2',3'-cyclic phosphodiesterase [Gracilibacillus sp. YIM 98692]